MDVFSTDPASSLALAVRFVARDARAALADPSASTRATRLRTLATRVDDLSTQAAPGPLRSWLRALRRDLDRAHAATRLAPTTTHTPHPAASASHPARTPSASVRT
jgi:hypothetical protein